MCVLYSETIKLTQSICCSHWIQKIKNYSPVITNALLKIEYALNFLRQGLATNCFVEARTKLDLFLAMGKDGLTRVQLPMWLQ